MNIFEKINDHVRRLKWGAKEKNGEAVKKMDSVKQEVYEHQDVVKQMLDIVALTPMHSELKGLMSLLLWGENPYVFSPLTIDDIATRWDVRSDVVRRLEEEAKYYMKEYLGKVGIIDITAKSKAELSDKTDLLKNLGEPG